MAVTTRKYNPGFLSDEELIESFCVRTTELELLVEVLRQCTGSANQHQIVIGPRGSGKTTLLLRVAAEVGRDNMLKANFLPVVFSEESYEISTAGEFWLECLTLLADQAPGQEDDTDLHRTVKELRAVRDDRMLGDRCLAALLDFADRNDRRLLLVVENLNMLFRDMSDIDAGWRLRKILQTEPRIIMFASATSRFEEIDHPERALYNFFQVRTLHRLNTRECEILWKAMTGRNPATNTVRPLEILTGGSPRLLVIVARFAVARSFRQLMEDLFDLIDDHTEYFKSHLDSLAPQERRVYLALAALWKPATTREIANHARLDTSKCSAQLARLKDRGMVDVTNNSVRRKQYYLTERIYNIYYLLRRGREADSMVEALIRFMEVFYSPEELKDLVVNEFERSVNNENGSMNSLQESLLKQLRVSLVFESDSKELEAKANQKLKTIRNLIDEMRLEEALAGCDGIEGFFGGNTNPTAVQIVVHALMLKGETLSMLNRHEDALDICDQVIQRFGDSEIPYILGSVAFAMVSKMRALVMLNRHEDALDICDQVIQRFGDSEIQHILGSAVIAMVDKGGALIKLNRHEEALDICDQVIQRFGDSEIPFISGLVASAFSTKGHALVELNRHEEALDVCDQMIERFGDSEIPHILELIVPAMANKMTALVMLNRHEEVLDICDQVIQRFGDSEIPFILELVALAMANKGRTLSAFNQPEDALDTYEEMIDRFGKSDFSTPRVGVLFADALLEKAAITLAESDVKQALSVLSISLSPRNIWILMGLSIDLGPRRMRELIQESPSKDLLLSLTTALERELGNEPRVAKEIAEVAQDIQQRLEEMRDGRRSQQRDLRAKSTEAVRDGVEKRKTILETPQK